MQKDDLGRSIEGFRDRIRGRLLHAFKRSLPPEEVFKKTELSLFLRTFPGRDGWWLFKDNIATIPLTALFELENLLNELNF